MACDARFAHRDGYPLMALAKKQEAAMHPLTRADLYNLEDYDAARPDFRRQVMAHKRQRKLVLGPHMTLHFEDRLTIQYQVQEMLRAERIFKAQDIEGELDAYNPLIPDGSNWKATMMIEYGNVEERKRALATLIGIEDRVWVRVDGLSPVYAIADEDLDRETAEKTSAVHFLRFDLSPEMARMAKEGAPVSVGVDHAGYAHVLDPVPEDVRASLARDLD
jgi:hypothetical protein